MQRGYALGGGKVDREALPRARPMKGPRFSIDTNILVYRVLRSAMRLKQEESFSFWDAMLLETARTAGVTRLLTEDLQDGRVLGALRVENPFKEGFALDLA